MSDGRSMNSTRALFSFAQTSAWYSGLYVAIG